MAQLYDLMLLIDASAPEDRQKAIVGEVEQMLSSGGTIVGAHDWGSRRIAFEIDHRPEATYHLFQFEGENDLLERVNRSLKIMDGVLRFRVIRQPPGSPPVPPSPEPVRARRDEEPNGRVAARAAADAAPDTGDAAGEAAEGAPVAAEAPAVEEPAAAPAVEEPAEAPAEQPAAAEE